MSICCCHFWPELQESIAGHTKRIDICQGGFSALQLVHTKRTTAWSPLTDCQWVKSGRSQVFWSWRFEFTRILYFLEAVIRASNSDRWFWRCADSVQGQMFRYNEIRGTVLAFVIREGKWATMVAHERMLLRHWACQSRAFEPLWLIKLLVSLMDQVYKPSPWASRCPNSALM